MQGRRTKYNQGSRLFLSAEEGRYGAAGWPLDRAYGFRAAIGQSLTNILRTAAEVENHDALIENRDALVENRDALVRKP